MTTEFHQDTLFNSQILEQLTNTQKKNCYLDYIHCSKTYMELYLSSFDNISRVFCLK